MLLLTVMVLLHTRSVPFKLRLHVSRGIHLQFIAFFLYANFAMGEFHRKYPGHISLHKQK